MIDTNENHTVGLTDAEVTEWNDNATELMKLNERISVLIARMQVLEKKVIVLKAPFLLEKKAPTIQTINKMNVIS